MNGKNLNKRNIYRSHISPIWNPYTHPNRITHIPTLFSHPHSFPENHSPAPPYCKERKNPFMIYIFRAERDNLNLCLCKEHLSNISASHTFLEPQRLNPVRSCLSKYCISIKRFEKNSQNRHNIQNETSHLRLYSDNYFWIPTGQ